MLKRPTFGEGEDRPETSENDISTNDVGINCVPMPKHSLLKDVHFPEQFALTDIVGCSLLRVERQLLKSGWMARCPWNKKVG